MARPKSLPDDQIRVTVRLPQTLVDALTGPTRRYRQTSPGHLSAAVRQALHHYLACPELQQAEAEAQAIADVQAAAAAQAVADWPREVEAKEAAREARRQAR
jgi:hypothetical protein